MIHVVRRCCCSPLYVGRYVTHTAPVRACCVRLRSRSSRDYVTLRSGSTLLYTRLLPFHPLRSPHVLHSYVCSLLTFDDVRTFCSRSSHRTLPLDFVWSVRYLTPTVYTTYATLRCDLPASSHFDHTPLRFGLPFRSISSLGGFAGYGCVHTRYVATAHRGYGLQVPPHTLLTVLLYVRVTVDLIYVHDRISHSSPTYIHTYTFVHTQSYIPHML